MFKNRSIKSKLAILGAFIIVGFSTILIAMVYMLNISEKNTDTSQKIEQFIIETNNFQNLLKITNKDYNFKKQLQTLQKRYENINKVIDDFNACKVGIDKITLSYNTIEQIEKDINNILQEINTHEINLKQNFNNVYDYKLLYYFNKLELTFHNFLLTGDIDQKQLRKTQIKFRNSVRSSKNFVGNAKQQQKITNTLKSYRENIDMVILKYKEINTIKEKLNNTFKNLSQNLEIKKVYLFNDLKEKNLYIQYLTFIISTLIVILLLVISNAISKNITISLSKFKIGLNEFLDVVADKKKTANPIELDSCDEIGNMAKEVNNGIVHSVKLLNHNREVLEEANDILQKVANGFYGYKIPHHNNVSPDVKDLIININKMLDQTKYKFDILNNALYSYGQYNFDYKLPKDDQKGLNGDFGTLVASTRLIGNNVAELAAMISNTGIKLNHDTHTLSNSAQELSVASVAQATSLEQTAAALEEITTNIQENRQNVTVMSNNATQLYETSITGKDLANKTSDAMDEINKEVNAISEAISVIDQIAFQTNILSLNAAVEAATAGEAGKGFAVVAAEVRNLATRSAEAANEIKALVESATNKTIKGKDITNKMSQGYDRLVQKINDTTQVIESVATASKEQELGITQINDTVSVLDNNTQINASNSQEISKLAVSISALSDDLKDLASIAKYNPKIDKQVCDIDLVHITSKVKNDHIALKTNNFEKIGSYESWEVVSDTKCDMGRWVFECETNNLPFTKHKIWKEIKETHHNVHHSLQTYIDLNHKKASNKELTKWAESIESNTLKLFDQLNELKRVNCDLLIDQ